MATASDYAMTALCLWREARGEGHAAMVSVACVLRNRVQRRGTSFYAEVVRPWQFSSISAKGDPQLTNYPAPADPFWQMAQDVARAVIDGQAQDATQGSTLYYDDSISFPATWNRAKVIPTVKIGRLNFFRETT